MLRSVTETTLKKCSRTFFQAIRFNTSGIPARKGGFFKKLFITASLTTGVASSAIAYAYYDPVFRSKVEENVPFAKEFFIYVRDNADNIVERTKRRTADLKSKVGSFLPVRKTNEPVITTDEKPLLRLEPKEPVIVSDEEPFLKLKHPEEVKFVPKAKVPIEPVDLKTPVASSLHLEPQLSVAVKRNRELEASLKAAIMSSESRVRLATEAKLATIAAINNHAKLLKEAVGNPQGANWELVSKAVEKADIASREDLAEENEARNYLDNVRRIINEGKQDKMTRYNPLLVNAAETVNKLDHQLDELKIAVRKSRDESRRVNQFRDLINQSRRIYAEELKELLPGIDSKAKDAALSEDDLNMLVAHAHLKVTQLRQQLADQQAREEDNIAKAIDEQRVADALIAEDELRLELKRLKDQIDVDYERKLMARRLEWEEETEERLRNAAAAHAEHLEQVVRTQRQLMDIEQAQKIDEAVGAERRWNSEQISAAQQKLEGIEVALSSRLAADIEHRRSKQFWIACQNLVDSVVHGRKAGLTPEERRTPLLNELKVIKEASAGDDYVQLVINAFSDESIKYGVYPEQDLKTRFAHLYKIARRIAKIDDNGGGLMQYFASYLQSAITFDLPRNYSLDEKFDPDSMNTYEILSRTKYFVDKGDLASAVRIAQLLKGEAGRLARDWIRDTRNHLEARFLVELLIAHAAVLNVRTTY